MLEAQVLKRGPKRTVLLERASGAPPVVIKRFHDPGRLGRFVDRWRARREDRRQRALRRAGLRTPEPIGLRRRAGRWEVVAEYVEGVTLTELLDGVAPWPVSRRRVAQALGRLLADLENAGFAHRDAHAGNVLIDASGTPWILDAGHVVERGMRDTMPERLAFLAELCAGVRERASCGFRRRVYESYWGALSTAAEVVPALLPSTPHLIEDDARARREVNVQQRLERWYRDSGATVVKTHTRLARVQVRVRPPGRYKLIGSLTLDEGLRRWLTHARFVEHGLPRLAPVARYPKDRARVVIAIPPGATQLTSAPEPGPLGALIGAVHDRGLFLPGLAWSDLWCSADGTLLLDAPVVETLATDQRTRQWESELPWDWSALPRDARRAFLLAYARASRHSRAERKDLEAQAEHA